MRQSGRVCVPGTDYTDGSSTPRAYALKIRTDTNYMLLSARRGPVSHVSSSLSHLRKHKYLCTKD